MVKDLDLSILYQTNKHMPTYKTGR